ncbi:MAG: hypothetical protein WCC48_07645, partial [Anaeromyxobacteraceae bacterium]
MTHRLPLTFVLALVLLRPPVVAAQVAAPHMLGDEPASEEETDSGRSGLVPAYDEPGAQPARGVR